jgi:3-oxoacyl-[acyl-carrier protein] reductase
VVDAIRAAGGRAVGVAGDCTDLAAVQQLRQEVEQQLGPAQVVAAFVGGGGRVPDRPRRSPWRTGSRPWTAPSPRPS